MDVGMLAGVVGAILTVIFGTLGIVLAIRARYPGRITAVVEDEIHLFEAIVRSVPGLTVAFEGEPVQPELILLKLAFVNDGTIDIEPAMAAEPPALELNSGFIWRAANIADASPKVTATISRSESVIVLNLGLLRRGEFVRLETIVQTIVDPKTIEPPAQQKDLRSALTINHRIANTQAIRIFEVASQAASHRYVRWLKTLMTLGILFIIIACVFVSLRGIPGELQYQMSIGGNVRWVRASPLQNGAIRLRSIEPSSHHVIVVPLAEFVKIPYRAVRVRADPVFKWTTITYIALYFAVPALLLLANTIAKRRLNRLRRIVC